jgi:hypothetical protein
VPKSGTIAVDLTSADIVETVNTMSEMPDEDFPKLDEVMRQDG